MDIFDRDWCNVFVWTHNGAALYHVARDTAYWRACFDVLAEFWWAHVVPAKHALAAGKLDAAQLCRCADCFWGYAPAHASTLEGLLLMCAPHVSHTCDRTVDLTSYLSFVRMH